MPKDPPAGEAGLKYAPAGEEAAQKSPLLSLWARALCPRTRLRRVADGVVLCCGAGGGGAATGEAAHLRLELREALLEPARELVVVLQQRDLAPGRDLAALQVPIHVPRRRVGHELEEVLEGHARHDGDAPFEVLRHDRARHARRRLDDLQERHLRLHVHLEVRLEDAEQEAAAPALVHVVARPAARLPDGALGAEEEGHDVRVALRCQEEAAVEGLGEAGDGDVLRDAPVEVELGVVVHANDAVLALDAQPHGVDEAGHGGGGEHRRAHDDVRRRDVVYEDGRRLPVRHAQRDVQHAARLLVRLLEGHGVEGPPLDAREPVPLPEERALAHEVRQALAPALVEASEALQQHLPAEVAPQLVVAARAHEGAHDGARRRAADDVGEAVPLEERLHDAEVVVAHGRAAAQAKRRAPERVLRALHELVAALRSFTGLRCGDATGFGFGLGSGAAATPAAASAPGA
eukprot:CAMPEP_0118853744 /NCGR_PEP_ID=MMETSP1163-20130328/2217_1 /TAXON_ID=124430 /ORGANISM="Phaeomonas parva, Strain CCMP2877" /LENGTH=461 /DNA_ID=CAMNT_0006786347 /DNA_START=300 /DNA_END=1682 /DNA_ORIENTATION=-